MHCQPERCTPLPLAQNLSSKRIVPTDDMWPKSDDTKRRHQLLKGEENMKFISATLKCASAMTPSQRVVSELWLYIRLTGPIDYALHLPFDPRNFSA